MLTRDITAAEFERARAWHAAQRLPYQFPDPSPLMTFVGGESKSGELAAIGAVRLTAEAFLWKNPEQSAIAQMRAIKNISETLSGRLASVGIRDVSAWVPPEVEVKFGPLLGKLGWRRTTWGVWSRAIMDEAR